MGRRKINAELLAYGYVFSLKKEVALYGGCVIGALLLGKFFRLNTISMMVLIVISIMMLPLFHRNAYKNRFEQQRFSDCNTYMEQFLYSFLKTSKIQTTLEEVQTLFQKGKMYDAIQSSREFIAMTFNEADVERKGLEIIEEEYPLSLLCTIHHFALEVEENGGDFSQSAYFLLESRRLWADRILQLQKEKQRRRREVLISIVVSLLVCSMIFIMSKDLAVTIAENKVAQIVTVTVLALDILIFYRADKKLSFSYITKMENETEILAAFDRFKKYDDRKLFDRVAKNAARKSLTREFEKVFPDYLMQLALLLQSENVQVAIFKSYENAPSILKPALEEFIFELKQNPTRLEPYENFLGDFAMPSVRSAMKMLYSISEGKGGDTSSQIADIIKRNEQLFDQAQKMKNEDALAGLYALFLAPQLTGGLKLMVDMILLLTCYISRFGLGAY